MRIITKYRLRRLTALLVLICIALIVYARSTRSGKNAYSLAGDLPRGALVYAQFENLPELIKQWAFGVEIDLALGRIQ